MVLQVRNLFRAFLCNNDGPGDVGDDGAAKEDALLAEPDGDSSPSLPAAVEPAIALCTSQGSKQCQARTELIQMAGIISVFHIRTRARDRD